MACENIEEKILKYLLEDEKLVKLVDFKACTNITGGDGNKTGLHLAATYDMDEMARLLIKGGCLIDAKDAKVYVGYFLNFCEFDNQARVLADGMLSPLCSILCSNFTRLPHFLSKFTCFHTPCMYQVRDYQMYGCYAHMTLIRGVWHSNFLPGLSTLLPLCTVSLLQCRGFAL